jgi:ubiquinone/menaquinone biosynthesis C-methylase UbiE
MNRKTHWENIYQTKEVNEVSWYREHLENSLRLIMQTGIGRNAAVIDIGGGSSTLVDDLLSRGFTNVSVLDISGQALETSRKRLGAKAQLIEWIEADITQVSLPENHYDVWHDRAVFHFLTDENDRREYIKAVKRSLKTGGHVIVASFGLNGPKKCSGLDVVQYSTDSMHAEFGKSFELVESLSETHQTPFGTTQEFIYCYCRLTANA